MLKIGQLDRQVEIKEGTFTQDSYGELIRSVSTLATVWAKFEFKGGKAGFEADDFGGTEKAMVTIRYRTDLILSPKHYIEYNSKKYFIRSIQEIGRKEGLLLMVEQKHD